MFDVGIEMLSATTEGASDVVSQGRESISFLRGFGLGGLFVGYIMLAIIFIHNHNRRP